MLVWVASEQPLTGGSQPRQPAAAAIPAHAVVMQDGEHRRRFSNPRRAISVVDAAGVPPALRELESPVEAEGLHAAGFIAYEAAAVRRQRLEPL